MQELKHSKQREAIKKYLESVYCHPTAETIFFEVKKEIPNISLGTVYRNLNLLVDMGEILKITTPNGPDRFDGHMQPHSHIRCVKCGELTDINIKEITEITKNAEKEYEGQINNCSIMFYGICKKCQNIK